MYGLFNETLGSLASIGRTESLVSISLRFPPTTIGPAGSLCNIHGLASVACISSLHAVSVAQSKKYRCMAIGTSELERSAAQRRRMAASCTLSEKQEREGTEIRAVVQPLKRFLKFIKFHLETISLDRVRGHSPQDGFPPR